jgi:hypothetical protein
MYPWTPRLVQYGDHRRHIGASRTFKKTSPGGLFNFDALAQNHGKRAKGPILKLQAATSDPAQVVTSFYPMWCDHGIAELGYRPAHGVLQHPAKTLNPKS